MLQVILILELFTLKTVSLNVISAIKLVVPGNKFTPVLKFSVNTVGGVIDD